MHAFEKNARKAKSISLDARYDNYRLSFFCVQQKLKHTGLHRTS